MQAPVDIRCWSFAERRNSSTIRLLGRATRFVTQRQISECIESCCFSDRIAKHMQRLLRVVECSLRCCYLAALTLYFGKKQLRQCTRSSAPAPATRIEQRD